MPIFVSRFSAERIASSGLRRVQNDDDDDRGVRSCLAERADRSERSERTREARGSERAQDQLPVATQTAESIRELVQARVSGQTSAGVADTDDRPTFPQQATLPGVPSSGSDSAVSPRARAGRLDSATQPPIRTSTSQTRGTDPFASRSAQVRQAFQNIASDATSFEGLQAQRLNTQIDATIRLLSSNASERAEVASQAESLAVETPDVEEPTVATPVSDTSTSDVEAAEDPVTPEAPVTLIEDDEPEIATGPPPVERPTAEQISRANTTPEIQQNLRENASDIGQGLRVDAEIESRENVRQTEVNAERSAEAERESQIDSNDEQVRDLTTQERQLEQSLRATQREIRDLNNESNRLETGSGDGASTAANLASLISA